jgi:hypothetical protein
MSLNQRKRKLIAKLTRQRLLESVSVVFLITLVWLGATCPDFGLMVFGCGISLHAQTLGSRILEVQVRDDLLPSRNA